MIKCEKGEITLKGTLDELIADSISINILLKKNMLERGKIGALNLFNSDLIKIIKCTNIKEFIELKDKELGGTIDD